jgi:hypothetical protein
MKRIAVALVSALSACGFHLEPLEGVACTDTEYGWRLCNTTFPTPYEVGFKFARDCTADWGIEPQPINVSVYGSYPPFDPSYGAMYDLDTAVIAVFLADTQFSCTAVASVVAHEFWHIFLNQTQGDSDGDHSHSSWELMYQPRVTCPATRNGAS